MIPTAPPSRTREVLGEKGRRIRELTALVQKRFGFPESPGGGGVVVSEFGITGIPCYIGGILGLCEVI